MVEPEIIQLPDRYVMGYVARIEPMGADYGSLWGQGFDPHEPTVAALAIEPGYYGVFYGTEQPGWVDFVAGMIVKPDTTPPEGLVLRALPGGTYARFASKMDAIGETWGAIYGQWLPTSGYALDEERPAMEHYPPGDVHPDMTISILVPVQKGD